MSFGILLYGRQFRFLVALTLAFICLYTARVRLGLITVMLRGTNDARRDLICTFCMRQDFA